MRVNEIFYSLQGEGRFTGTAAIFIRLSGCNLRCSFCDPRHDDYTLYTENDIVAAIASYPARHVVITGGEPTLQLTRLLVDKLHEAGKFVQIETNGSIALEPDVVAAIDWITCSPKALPVKMSSRWFMRGRIWLPTRRWPARTVPVAVCSPAIPAMQTAMPLCSMEQWPISRSIPSGDFRSRHTNSSIFREEQSLPSQEGGRVPGMVMGPEKSFSYKLFR